MVDTYSFVYFDVFVYDKLCLADNSFSEVFKAADISRYSRCVYDFAAAAVYDGNDAVGQHDRLVLIHSGFCAAAYFRESMEKAKIAVANRIITELKFDEFYKIHYSDFFNTAFIGLLRK